MELQRGRETMFGVMKTVTLSVVIAWTSAVGAQGYPAKPVRILIGFPAGSTVDILARPVALRMTKLLGQQVVVDNRAGATGIIANELRSYFGVVPQETQLFSGSIYDNLVLANPLAAFDQVVEACKIAEIHETIERLPQGYQTAIGEHGVGLSGGQKQRIAIARAWLKGPKLLIFDEATSGLDAETAEHFAQTINQLRGKVGTIFIAHQLPKALAVDDVVELGSRQ